MAESITEAADKIETAIILALHARPERRKTLRTKASRKGWVTDSIDLDHFCPAELSPRACYTFDMSGDHDRLFTADWNNIVVDPVAAIGSRLETMFICDDGRLKWTAIAPMKAPRGMAPITNKRGMWLAIHYREIDRDGSQLKYVRHPAYMTDDGCVPLRVMGWTNYDPRADAIEMTEVISMALSLFEDAHRAGSMLATVAEDVRLMFPVGDEAYVDFFRLRDGPNETPTGRKNPILHWCGKHLRNLGADKETPVRRHLRGTEALSVGNMTLTISPNEGFHKMANP